MHIIVTGAAGFIGKSLMLRLHELGHADVVPLTRDSSESAWQEALARADVVFHVAGVNRPSDPAEFMTGNADLTTRVCDGLRVAGRRATIVLTSSTQAESDNQYGASKRAAEARVREYASASGARGCVMRLPNVFGKWARPGYNSAVATFCSNAARGLPLVVNVADAPLRLVYIDDVLDAMVGVLSAANEDGDVTVSPVYETTVGAVAKAIEGFAIAREDATIPPVGGGLMRALYATYLSYLRPAQFDNALTRHDDARGSFAEIVRTHDSGQVSYFTAHPGITRGEHYHHTKNERFVVVSGRARFSFREILSGERYDLEVSGDALRVVHTVPGWCHNITNIGETELVVVLWANEAFDTAKPDTVASRVAP